MKVLVVNAGSSSLKYQLFDTSTMCVDAKGICERIGIDGKITHKMPGRPDYKADIPMRDHTEATRVLIKTLTSPEVGCIGDMSEIEAVGHRIVHGGAYFSESVLVTPEVVSKLGLCRDLAPLHTGAHLMGLKGITDAMPGTPQVLVFDTAFHQTMPDYAWMYPIPYEMYEKYSIRRYGAHGTSHRYVSARCAELMGKPIEELKLISCHMGNGSSICAIEGGKSVDTSMGFTPLAGLPMGTRSGDLDAGILQYLMNKYNMNIDEMLNVLNKKSGVQGVSGVSSDFRDLENAHKEGNERAGLAVDMFNYGVKKYIGAYAAAMGGVDAIIFTAGVGENSASQRLAIASGLEFMGVKMDAEANNVRGKEAVISAPDSKVKVLLIPTNEELMIATDTAAIVKGN